MKKSLISCDYSECIINPKAIGFWTDGQPQIQTPTVFLASDWLVCYTWGLEFAEAVIDLTCIKAIKRCSSAVLLLERRALVMLRYCIVVMLYCHNNAGTPLFSYSIRPI